MTNEEAAKMMTAKVECMKRESSGEDLDCNHRNCDECELCYAQGTIGEQKEALKIAVEALQNHPTPMSGASDLISRCELFNRLATVKDLGEAFAVIQGMPTAEPERIYCRDCIHYRYADDTIPQEHRCTCDLDGDRWKPDDYCSFAKRRTNGVQNE